MKKFSLLLASAMLATVSAFAQTKPTVTTFVNFDEALKTDATYYLYNVEAGLFLTQGNEWATRASVIRPASPADNGSASANPSTLEDLKFGKAIVSGLPWTISLENPVTVDGEETTVYSLKQEAASVSEGTKTKYGYISADDWNDDGECTGIWIDGEENIERRPNYPLWYVNKLSNNTIQLGNLIIKTEGEEKTYTKCTGWFGVQNLADGDSRTYIKEGDNTTWALVDETTYESVQPKLNLYYVQIGLAELIAKGNAQQAGKYDKYSSLVNSSDREAIINAINEISPLILLGEALSAAKAVDPARDYSKFENIYNSDEEITEEQLNEATTLLKALTALYESISKLAGHDNSVLLAVYNSDESTLTEINDTKALAEAYLALKEAIDKAKAEHPTLDFSEPEAVYAKPDATKEELADAKAKVQLIIDTDAASDATAENPVDYSHYITNATFDTIGNFTGWSGTAFSAGGTTSTNAEHYSKNYDTYQDLNGGQPIPNGIYKLGVTAFYRAGSIQNDWNTRNDPSARHAKLYGTSGDVTKTTDLPSLASWATPNYLVGSTITDGDVTYYVPNTMADFTSFKDNGYGSSTDLFIPVTNAKLRVGVKKSVLIDTDWTIVDDFTLTYYGNGVDAYQLMASKIIEVADAKLSTYDWNNIYYTKSLKAAYEAAKAAVKASNSSEEILALTGDVDKLADSLVNNVATWEKYVQTVDDAAESEVLQTNSGEYVDRLAAYVELYEVEEPNGANEFPNGSYSYIVKELTLSTAELEAEIEFVAQLLDDAIKKSMEPGQDVSNLLVNPKFTNGFTGWTNKAGNVGDFSSLTPPIPNNVEVYSNVVDCYQVVTDVPDGIYSLSVKAFERPAGNGNYDGTEPSKVFLYMNDFQTEVQNIVKDAIPEDEAEDGVNCYLSRLYTSGAGNDLLDYLVDGAGYVPNGMVGAAVAFGAGRYEQKVYGLIEGGTMKIGLTSNGVNAHWVLWADFKLTYEGKSEEALEEVLNAILARAENYLDNNFEMMTEPASTKLDDTIVAAYDAQESGDADEMWEAIVALNKVLSESQKNVDALAKLQSAIDNMKDIAEFGDPSDAAMDAYNEIADQIDEDAYMQLTTEEVEKLTEEVIRITGLLSIPRGYEDASDDNPFEMTSVIVNPDFSIGNASGWTYEFEEITNIGYQSNSVYTNGDISLNQFIEGWRSGNNPIGDGTIEQTIPSLPAGTYVLGADVIANLQSGTAEDTKGMYLFALESNGDKSAIEVATDNGAPEHFELTFKKASDDSNITIGLEASKATGNWLAADNFTLFYYGKDSALEADGDPTLIEEISVETPAVAAIYTVTGAKVSTLQKGINIVKYANGKVAKVLVK